jgi:hypothetical protein
MLFDEGPRRLSKERKVSEGGGMDQKERLVGFLESVPPTALSANDAQATSTLADVTQKAQSKPMEGRNGN